MATVALRDLERDPLTYLHRVEQGETFTVVRDARAVATITPVASAPATRQPRPFGLAAGEFAVPADFNSPLPDDVIRDFEGG